MSLQKAAFALVLLFCLAGRLAGQEMHKSKTVPDAVLTDINIAAAPAGDGKLSLKDTVTIGRINAESIELHGKKMPVLFVQYSNDNEKNFVQIVSAPDNDGGYEIVLVQGKVNLLANDWAYVTISYIPRNRDVAPTSPTSAILVFGKKPAK